MSSIDERVVQMRFDNAAFERGIARTRDSLGRFTKELEMKGATKGLSDVEAAAKRLSFKNIESGVQAVAGHIRTLSTSAVQGLEKVGHGVQSVATKVQAMSANVAKNLNSIDNEGKKVSFKNIEQNVQAISDRFRAMSVVATTALATIAHQAISAGGQLVKSFTFSPVMDGFREYETNLNSIQTILANTQAAGTNLQDVTKALDELNHYSDQTIYNFSEMAKNIGTFTAAGVALKPATAAIKGIANLAALSGSNSEQASGAMYQLSQAISAGRVTLEDWNSVVNAGMGGTVFQRALALNAEKMGTLSKGAVKLKGDMKNVTIEGKSFRESITAKPGQESWLTSDVLTRTLSQFTGDLSDAELAAQGFSKAQIKAIQDQAKMAKSAATEVKTATQLFGTFKEQLGSGWAQTWQIIFGDFAEAKGLFTGISNSIGGILQRSSDARNKMLKDWDKLGGRKALIEGITNVFKALGSVAAPIKDAFRDIFPATTGKQLADMTKNFAEFTKNLKIGDETAGKLRRTFAGVFAIFGIAFDIIGGVVGVIFDLFGVITKGSGGLLNFTAGFGDFLVALRKGIQEGEGLKNFFSGLSAVLSVPIRLVQLLGAFLAKLFEGSGSSNVEKKVEGISSKLEPLGRLGEVVATVWGKVLTVMENVGSFFNDLGARIAKVLSSIGIEASSMFEGLDFEKVLAAFNTGLFAGLVLLIKNFAGGGPAGLLDGISDAIEGFTNTLGAMQNTLRATTLLQIAIAIGILAVSMNILSKIDQQGLMRASVAIAQLFSTLILTLLAFEKMSGFQGLAKMPLVAAGLILLSTAVVILTHAMENMAALDWNGLAKGLTGVTVLLGSLVAVSQFIKNPSGLISTGLGMIVLATGVKILVSAVTDLAGLDWNELAKGLVGVGTLLGALVLFTMFAKVNKGGLLQGAGLLLLAVGIKILASAVKDMAKMSWGEIAKGLVTLAGALAIITAALMFIPPTAPLAALGVLGIAISLGMIGDALQDMAKMSWAEIGSSLTVMLGALTIIAAALYVIPPTAPLAAAGVLITAIALQQVAKVLEDFAQYSWEEIGKAMTMLAGTLGIIAAALFFMTGALPGAAATLIVAAALRVLAPVLQQFGQMSLAEIGKSLLMLAGVFATFAISAILLAPVVPVMIALGLAVTLLGVGMLAAGAGVFLFATGLTALAAAGAAGTAAIVGIVMGLIGLIPELMKQIGLGIIAFAKVIQGAGPAILKAITVVLEALISAIVRLTPKIVDALLRMMSMMVKKMSEYIPRMVDSGLKLLTGILNGIANNLGKVAGAATRVIQAFLKAIGDNVPKVAQSGVDLIIKFINALTRTIDNNSAAMGAAGGRLAVAIVKGMARGIMAGLGEIASAAKSVASSALDAAKGVLGIHSPSKEFEKIGKYVIDGFRKGLDGNKASVNEAMKKLSADLKTAMRDSAKDVDVLESKLKRLTSARKRDNDEIRKTRKALAQAKKENKAEVAAYVYVTTSLKKRSTALGKLADQQDKINAKLEDAKKKLEDLVKTRADFKAQIIDQYDNLPEITPETKVSDYESDLQKQIEKTKQFANTLQRLRDLGLNDESYRQLLSKGIDALPFANELLAGGKEEINKVNDLNNQLSTVAKSLGVQASSELYDAAVKAAEGLVKGLQNQQKAIEKQMDAIADAMVRAIKKKLGIKSPSRVFMAIGRFSAEGVAKGVDEMSGLVEESAANLGTAAADSLRKSLSNVADMVNGDIDTRPVITPVLDLSSVRKDAGQISGLITAKDISIDSAYAKARFVAASYASNQAAAEQSDISTPVTPVTFIQNNNSPKALSSAEIYRQTKNQLSMKKGALKTTP